MNTKNIIFGASLLGISYVSYLYLKRPKATISITDDDSGQVTLGSKTKPFDVQKSATIKKKGWELTASANSYNLKFLGMCVEKGKGTFVGEPDYKKMVGKLVEVKYDF